MKVVRVTVETAEFDDGSAILRQRPWVHPSFALNMPILQPDNFRKIFSEGASYDLIMTRLKDPDFLESADGDPGDPMTRVRRQKIV